MGYFLGGISSSYFDNCLWIDPIHYRHYPVVCLRQIISDAEGIRIKLQLSGSTGTISPRHRVFACILNGSIDAKLHTFLQMYRQRGFSGYFI